MIFVNNKAILYTRYFTVTMINQFTTYYDDHRIIKFPQTTMGRNLLQVDVSETRKKIAFFFLLQSKSNTAFFKFLYRFTLVHQN